MIKEKLTLEAIKQDLRKIVEWKIANKSDWRLSYIIPSTLLAVLIGILLQNLLIGILIFSVAAYHIIRYVMEYNEYKKKRRAVAEMIERGDISISIEQLSHIAEETIYEPYHTLGGRNRSAKTVKMYYFQSSACWRVPFFNKHYEWSKNFYISTKGLENISISGDDFYYVSLQGNYDIAYIYPCKNFALDSGLIIQ